MYTDKTKYIKHKTSEQLRLSFIVPFYGVEKYIEKCIRSLYDQDIPMEEYEVICVDDCSPDGSRAIVERLQKEYPTLRLICHPKNKRQGGARNTGLREAQGKYICFIDSDDYIQPKTLKQLLEEAEDQQLDILKFLSVKEGELIRGNIYKESSIVTGSEFVFDLENGMSMHEKCSAVWGQFINSNLIREYNLLFAEVVQYEDDDYSYQLYAYAQRVKFVPVVVNVIREIPDSTTRRANDIRRVCDIFMQAERMIQLVPILMKIDERWEKLISMAIRDSFEHQIFRMLKDCSFKEQLHFWYVDRRNVSCFRPYLSRKSYIKLSSYIMWKILQK